MQLRGIRPVLSFSNLYKTMKNKLFILSILVTAIAAMNGCHSSTSPSNPSLQGAVFLVDVPPSWAGYDNSGTDIYVENTGYHTTTDSSGHFTIPSLDPSENTIIVSHSSYAIKRFYHEYAVPTNNFEAYLYPLQPQNPALIDSVVLKDTIISRAIRTGVVIGTNGDTLNQGTVTMTSTHDTNVLVYGHSTVAGSSTAVVYFGKSQPNPLDTNTFFATMEYPLSYDKRFVVEIPNAGNFYFPFVNSAPTGSTVYVSAFATPFAGILGYSDSLRAHGIYSLFNGAPGNVVTFINP
jgi:hypothetical protein